MDIKSNDFLLRRVFFRDPNYVKEDGTITSLAFRPRSSDAGKLSVDIERLSTYDKSIQDAAIFRIGKLSVTVPLNELDMQVLLDPIEDNLAHALIIGDFSKQQCRTLARNTTIVAFP